MSRQRIYDKMSDEPKPPVEETPPKEETQLEKAARLAKDIKEGRIELIPFFKDNIM